MGKVVVNRFKILLKRKERKERRKIILKEVAEALGVTPSTVWLYSANRTTRFDGRVVAAMCEYFNCKVGDLLVLEEKEETPETS